MRKLLIVLLIIGIALSIPQAIADEQPASPRPILVTSYRQVGWGDSLQIGYVDEGGNLWFLDGYDHDLNWPSN